ncbi:hypothetical protein QEN19_003722 [Hanseniaspora menglaensis]
MNQIEDIKKLQIKNRLLSIVHDRFYIETKLKFPKSYSVIPNERCGNWYLKQQELSCYFKSTDGHSNQWNFSYRRLNLNILPSLYENKGIVIVDSSKYRKIPDSLSKTIPIWCCVLGLIINESFFLNTKNEVDLSKFNIISEFFLRLPIELEIVKNEYNSILNKLIEFYKESKKYHPNLKDDLKKLGFHNENSKTLVNLKPFWVYPGSKTINDLKQNEYFNEISVTTFNIILCSCSDFHHISRHHKMIKCQPNKEHNKYQVKFDYYQGAGDDHELWSPKLDAQAFNKNIIKFDQILQKTDSNSLDLLFNYIDNLSPSDYLEYKKANFREISSNIFLTTNDSLKDIFFKDFDMVVCFGSTPNVSFPKCSKLYPYLKDDKKGIRYFASICSKLDTEVFSIMKANQNQKILISSESYELNIGTVIIMLVKYNCDSYKKENWNKLKIRQLYLSICEKMGENINTSRLLLNTVNQYLLS